MAWMALPKQRLIDLLDQQGWLASNFNRYKINPN